MRNTNVEDSSPPNDMERLVTRAVSITLMLFVLGVSYFFWNRQIENFQQTVLEGRMSMFAREEGSRIKMSSQFARPESIVNGQ
jgi:ATP-dependent Zn protease